VGAVYYFLWSYWSRVMGPFFCEHGINVEYPCAKCLKRTSLQRKWPFAILVVLLSISVGVLILTRG
jgi:hypothetical protein